MTMASVVSWALAFMSSLTPPGRHAPVESKEDASARYLQIADAAVSVAYDPEEEPLFAGHDGRARTALLMLSVAFHESHFRRDVDLGIGPRARGDHGQSYCLMQLHVGNGATAEGWRGEDLVEDRERCFRAGLALMRRSFGVCRKNPVPDLLTAYVSGQCDRGRIQSRTRVQVALDWLARHPLPRATALQPTSS